MAAGKFSLHSTPAEYLLTEGDIDVPNGTALYHLPEGGDFTFHLRHIGQQLLLRGVIKVTGETSPNLKTRVVHHASETQAETVLKTLASDRSQPRYLGMIEIMPQASGCESYLSHHSLLLDPEARSWSVPSLEIKNNEVKCSHSATLRTITDQDLFYLRSRGLSRDSARQLTVEAFLVT